MFLAVSMNFVQVIEQHVVIQIVTRHTLIECFIVSLLSDDLLENLEQTGRQLRLRGPNLRNADKAPEETHPHSTTTVQMFLVIRLCPGSLVMASNRSIAITARVESVEKLQAK
jgi:anaerobic C4-dicarboxylate transporter